MKARFTAKDRVTEQSCREKYGCDLKIWRLFRQTHQNYQKTPLYPYLLQRRKARKREVGWNLSILEWWAIWTRSKKYSQRGRKGHQYCMARIFDENPYEVGNVYITTCKLNMEHRKIFNGVKQQEERRTVKILGEGSFADPSLLLEFAESNTARHIIMSTIGLVE